MTERMRRAPVPPAVVAAELVPDEVELDCRRTSRAPDLPRSSVCRTDPTLERRLSPGWKDFCPRTAWATFPLDSRRI